MAAHGSSRATVREALALLRQEGLIERVQGIGTFATYQTVVTRLVESHGVERSGASAVWSGLQRPRVLDRAEVPTPDAVAHHMPDCGSTVMRIDYVAMLGDDPVGMATNYLRFPEADAVADLPFESDFYALIEAGGLRVGASEFLIGCANADERTAELLDVVPGSAVATLEQLIYDEAGRVFDVAFCCSRADRFLMLSRAESPSFRVAAGVSGRLP
jgi:GntR family transcriptional regulator